MSRDQIAGEFSHLDEEGQVRMVDVTDKPSTRRTARARGRIRMSPATVQAILSRELPKGNVLTTAKLAGISAAKKTAELIPLCHPLNLTWVDIDFQPGDGNVAIEAVVKATETTGLEMEALSAVTVAALTIYDMCKAVDTDMVIEDIHLVEKTGGKSSDRVGYRPRTAVVVVSDSTAAGQREDVSGKVLIEGFGQAGCRVEPLVVVPDEADQIGRAVSALIEGGVELLVTTGGTGLGPRDVTISTIEQLFDERLPGVEQALHAYGRTQLKTAMLSRLAVGMIGASLVVCLPGSRGAAKDALRVLVPGIFHAFEILQGAGHQG
ncbi:MAG: bifunctional molybdenum cofactor biosynthesis protein MoaC/MoaB [Candidatus Marinimicrobia bacterium]|nr:bifunctional molybdenum cofactor biosynthesis protein MoaC/MoaB [Candidatus Neomarinimicrobiota bacterium]